MSRIVARLAAGLRSSGVPLLVALTAVAVFSAPAFPETLARPSGPVTTATATVVGQPGGAARSGGAAWEMGPAEGQEPERVEGQDPAHAEEQEPAHAEEEDDHAAGGEHGDEGEHGAEEHHGPTWTEVAQKWINFVLLLGLLWWLLVVPPAFVVENFEFPGLKVVLASRGQDILRSRDLAQEQTAEAEKRLEDSARRLENVEEEVAGLVADAESDAAEERERIIAAAREEADRIRDGAQRDLGVEVVRARRDLKRHVADLSVGMAAEMLRDNLSSEDQDRLVRQYLDRLGETVH